ncbi:MAG: 2-oxo acid dehydrogenase subunit E2 [Kangiellaceae bacterium]|nr:2-oxo acid dehydrogenase subunit E2 [Kangiellaceae bacterium]
MTNAIDISLSAEQLEGTEATFSCWLVEEGAVVKEGQPIAELETDKVAIEICAERSGSIQSLLVKQGDKVETEQKLGSIMVGGLGEADQKKSHAKLQTSSKLSDAASQPNEAPEKLEQENQSVTPQLSPAVRRLIKENDLDVSNIKGTGNRARVTREDVLKYLASPPAQETNKSASIDALQSKTITNSPLDGSLPTARALEGELIPHSNMRKSIASHMVSSLLEISPHVTSVFEMDMSNIIEHRKWHKKEFIEHQVKLTFTAYFLAAMAKTVAKVPQVNAKFHEDALEIFSDVNIGVGTALGGSDLKDSGLVVPVIQQVQNMNLFQIAKSLSIQTEKARTNQLKPSDMKNGTLTISNHGVSGSLFATPIIINQPQVAILGVGKLEKRVVVEEIDGVDEMVIRPKCYVSLSIDHRALDAHQTNLFLSEFVAEIESWGD